MPYVNVKVVEGAFTAAQKHALAAALTDVMVRFEGSEVFREVVWVLIEEHRLDGWHLGGRPFVGPMSLPERLKHSGAIYEMIDGEPAPCDELAASSPRYQTP